MTQPAFPDGHFYSPIVDVATTIGDAPRLWGPVALPSGIDLKPEEHERLLRTIFPRLMGGYDYATSKPTDGEVDRFYDFNGQFERQDPRVLYCMLQLIQPKRIVEVGSGFSSLLMVDVNRRLLQGACSITCVEPYPRPFLRKAAEQGDIELVEARAQDVSLEQFTGLSDGDVLFIDSSHVSKTGSDVNRLILEVLPRLQAGVYVHFHDIFIPAEYPRKWIELGFSWNEQYVLQAFLAMNPGFEIVYGSAIARELHAEALGQFLGDNPPHGGSLWIRRR
jgi:predicted O-methyltransferase YrrM